MTARGGPPITTPPLLPGSAAGATPHDQPYRILLVEDDRGDAVLVEAALEEQLPGISLRWRTDLPSADEVRQERPDCILVDLGLPGLAGLETLELMLARSGSVPVIVLTGLDDRTAGVRAVAQGASDYLVKGEHDGDALARAVTYAVERAHAESQRTRLLQTELLRSENVRLERGLLPRPILSDPDVVLARRYRPGADTSVLGGDFFDVVERPDGSIRLVVGDVSGHGPDEAALGVCLRIAWRTLVLRGTPDAEVLPVLEELLVVERQDHQFATVCDITISADRRLLSSRVAGHPPPIVLSDEAPHLLENGHRGVPLGVRAGLAWPTGTVVRSGSWGLLAYTDGVFEPLRADGSRVELAGLLELVAAQPRPTDAKDLDALLEAVGQPHLDAGHTDDLAAIALLVDTASPSTRRPGSPS